MFLYIMMVSVLTLFFMELEKITKRSRFPHDTRHRKNTRIGKMSSIKQKSNDFWKVLAIKRKSLVTNEDELIVQNNGIRVGVGRHSKFGSGVPDQTDN